MMIGNGIKNITKDHCFFIYLQLWQITSFYQVKIQWVPITVFSKSLVLYVNESMTQVIAFRAGARPVFSQNKFRDETEGERICYHITVDPRVARGSVYSHHKRSKDTVQPIHYRPRAIPAPKHDSPKGKAEEEDLAEDKEFRPDLLEIDDRPIEEDLATAAETYIQRPPTPHFVPDEPGVDVETQVWDGDLFNYESEVRPMIKVIVQHTLLRALAEVHEEVEVENIRQHKDRYEVERNIILAELQRLEAKGARKFDEDKRRREQRLKAATDMAERNEKLASAGFGEGFSVEVMLAAMDGLERRGTFFDEVEAEVEDQFLPWLSGEIDTALEVRRVLEAVKRAAAKRGMEIRRGRIERFQVGVQEPRKMAEERMAQAMRRVFVEDRGAEAIRTRLKEEKERKEREAVEKAERAAKAEADAEAAAQAAAEEAAKQESEKEETIEEESGVSDSN
jgi:hypothetical protein